MRSPCASRRCACRRRERHPAERGGGQRARAGRSRSTRRRAGGASRGARPRARAGRGVAGVVAAVGQRKHGRLRGPRERCAGRVGVESGATPRGRDDRGGQRRDPRARTGHGDAHHDRRAGAARAPIPWSASRTRRRQERSSRFATTATRPPTFGRAARTCGRAIIVMRAGTTLGAAQIGVLASVGCARPHVHRRPRVAILAIGRRARDRRAFRRRRSRPVASSRRTAIRLEAAVRAARRRAGRARHRRRRSRGARASCSRGAEGCDLIITSGGVSVGDFDFTREVVGAWARRCSSGACACDRVRPSASARLLGVPWLGLPGNPVSAMVTFELFARPLIRRLRGRSTTAPAHGAGRAGEEVVQSRAAHAFPALPSSRTAPTAAARRASPDRRARACSRRCRAADGAARRSARAAAAVTAVSLLRALPLDGDLGGSTSFPG